MAAEVLEGRMCEEGGQVVCCCIFISLLVGFHLLRYIDWGVVMDGGGGPGR